MPTHFDILRQIDAIVNHNTELEHTALLKFDWEAILTITSAGLILPHVYVSLRNQKLLDFLEEDFSAYLLLFINFLKNNPISKIFIFPQK